MTTKPRARGGGLARRLLLAVLALVAVLPIVTLGAQSASASVYTQHACTTRAGTDHFSFTSSGSYFRQLNTCSSGGVLGGAFFSTVAHVNGDHATWSYAAPFGTTVVRLAGSYAKAAGPHRDYGDAGAFLTASNGRTLDSCSTFRGCKGGYGTNTWDLSASPATSFRFGAMCGGSAGCPAGLTEYALSNIAIGLDDNTNPDVTGPVSGPLMNDTVLHGAPAVSLVAHDTGGGLRSVQLLTDGHLVSETPIDLNGGACKDYDPNNNNPYEYAQAVPCKLAASGSFNLDTTPLPDGSHRLDVQISDAAGNTSVIGTRTAVVDNHPPVVSTTLSGDAQVGGVLTCNPKVDGQDATLQYEWLRTNASTAQPTVIAGQAGRTYTVVATDAGHQIECRVTATDRGGSATATSNPSSVVPTPIKDPNHHPTPPPDNGHGATAKATVRSWWSLGGKGKTATVTYGFTPTARGVVLNDQGKPIVGATIDLIIYPAAAGRKPIVKTGLISRAGGRITYRPGVGIDSRRIEFRYRPNLKDSKVAGRDSVKLWVRASVRLKMKHGAASVASNRPLLRFVGRVRGPKLKGQLVEVRVKRGHGWLTFGRAVRVSRSGRFHLNFRVASSLPRHVNFRFKAVARQQRGYGFLTGTSNTVRVRVR